LMVHRPIAERCSVTHCCTQQLYNWAACGYMKAIPTLSLSVAGRGVGCGEGMRAREVTWKNSIFIGREIFFLWVTDKLFGDKVKDWSRCLPHLGAYVLPLKKKLAPVH